MAYMVSLWLFAGIYKVFVEAGTISQPDVTDVMDVTD